MHIVAANTDHFSNPKKYYGIQLQDLFHIEELFSLHYFEYMSTFSFPGESHDFWEFVCVDKGEVEIGAGPLTHTLRRGEIAFHYPGEFHWVKANGKIAPNLIVISFSCTDPAMEFFRGKILHLEETERRLLAGIIAIRKMHIRAMQETYLTAADEMLYPENRSYLDDILSYEAIGARSVENQQHRLTASGMDIPIGMKNPTSGDLSVMLNSVVAAQGPHRFIYRGQDVTTGGNDLAHVILRGGVDKYGTTIPNYHYEDCKRLLDMYEQKNLKNPAAIIDANHSNSNKQYKEQLRIVSEVLHTRNYDSKLKKLIKGVMVESYLVEGRQDIGGNMVYGKSITDPCIGWEDTVRLIDKIAEDC